MPKDQDVFGRWRRVEWAQEKEQRYRWGQIKVDLGGQFRNLNPVSRAMGSS